MQDLRLARASHERAGPPHVGRHRQVRRLSYTPSAAIRNSAELGVVLDDDAPVEQAVGGHAVWDVISRGSHHYALTCSLT
jgi:hypothetical protein